MTIGIGKFNRSSNFLGPGPKKCRNKSLDFSEFQLVFGSPILFTYVGIEEPSTATISPEKPFSGFVLASTVYRPTFFSISLGRNQKEVVIILEHAAHGTILFC